MSLAVVIFGILGILAIASALFTIASRHPVHAAFGLVFHFFMLAGLYLTLNAEFIAVIQILVYAGAIMVLVIFVIMLLNLGSDEALDRKYMPKHILGVLFSVALTVMIVAMVSASGSGLTELPGESADYGSVYKLGTVLYTEYVFPVLAIAILLCAAIVGAIVLAKRKLD